MRDVVEIGGFDPSDGQPLVRFIERRGYVVIVFSHNEPLLFIQPIVSDSASLRRWCQKS